MMGLRLNIGGNLTKDRFPKGWKCVDIANDADYQVDVGNDELPFDSNSIQAIYCSHMLEHIYPHLHPYVFSEFYRVLEPGGFLRVVVPDMDIALKSYFKKWCNETTGVELPTGVKKKGYQLPPLYLFSVMDWWFGYDLNELGKPVPDHVTGFNWEILAYRFNEANFLDYKRSEYNKGNAVFFGCDNPIHEETSVYGEARKVGKS